MPARALVEGGASCPAGPWLRHALASLVLVASGCVSSGNVTAEDAVAVAQARDRSLQQRSDALEQARQEFARSEFGAAIREQTLGHLDQSLRHLWMAVVLDPDSARLHRELGRCLIRLGRASEAVAPLEKARLLAPETAAGLLELAEAYRISGRQDDALHCLLEAHVRHPDGDRPPLLLHALLLLLDRNELGMDLFQALVADGRRPDWSFGQEALGDFLLRSGQPEAARDRFLRALELGGSERSLRRKLWLTESKLSARHEPSTPARPGFGLATPPPTPR